jgi:L-ascorbate metabolism protein UlaG (beta-lactamase superfamily)
MQIIWFGHASFKIVAEDQIIYIDPYAGEDEYYEEAANIILVSHSHVDHCDGRKIGMIKKEDTLMLTTEELVHRFDSIKATPGQDFISGRIKITVIKAYNTNKPNHPEDFGVGYIIEAEGKKIYFAGDTDLIPEMDNIQADIALLPVGGTYTMNAKEAAKAAIKVKCRLAIPMHWGYGLVGKLYDAEEFKEILIEENINVIILEPGQKVEL